MPGKGKPTDPGRRSPASVRLTEGDHVWLEKSYNLQVTSDDEGNVVVAVGVWGTFEVERTYYIDDLRITFTER